MHDSAAGPVHDVCQQDDDQDDDHQPEEEHSDSGDDVPSYSSRSSHGLQLPGATRIIRKGAARDASVPNSRLDLRQARIIVVAVPLMRQCRLVVRSRVERRADAKFWRWYGGVGGGGLLPR